MQSTQSTQNKPCKENKPSSIQIREYNLVSFVQAVASAGKKGYIISDTNEGYPRQFIGEFFTEMILQEDNDVQDTQDVQQSKNVQEQRSAGRPRKFT